MTTTIAALGVSSSNTPAQNTTALQNALEAAASTDNVDILVPPGDYHFHDGVSIDTPHRITFNGEVLDGCNLHFHGTTGGLKVEYLDYTKPTAVQNLNFITHSNGGGTALHLKGPNLPTATEGGLQVVNVDVRGVTPGVEYFKWGIHCENAWHPYIFRPDIQGRNPGETDPQAANPLVRTFLADGGLKFTDCQAPQVRDPIMLHLDTGIKADGSVHGEGLNATGGELIGVGVGIDWSIGVYKPCIYLGQMHINAYRTGVNLTNVGQFATNSLHVYKTQLSRSNWSAMQLSNCHDNDISLKAYNPGCPLDTGGSANGIVAINSDCNQFDIQAGQWHTAGAAVVFIGVSKNNRYRVRKGLDSTRLNKSGYVAYTGTAAQMASNVEFA